MLLDRPRKIYLSGPMSGLPENNYPLFNKAARALRDAGHDVYNPAESGWFEKGPRAAFAAYSRYICEEADTLVLLPGFIKSVGVSAELALARNCGLDAYTWPDGHKIL